MWCMGAFQAANSRSHAEQPVLIRRRDASSSLVVSVEVYVRAPHPIAPRDPYQPAKWVSADPGLASEFPPVIFAYRRHTAHATRAPATTVEQVVWSKIQADQLATTLSQEIVASLATRKRALQGGFGRN